MGGYLSLVFGLYVCINRLGECTGLLILYEYCFSLSRRQLQEIFLPIFYAFHALLFGWRHE